MADDFKNQDEPGDRPCISIKQEHEVRYWTERSRTISVEASAARASSGALLHPDWRVTRQISRPTSFLSRPRGPTWTSRRPTRSGQLRPRWRLRWMCYACAFPSPALSLAKLDLAYFSAPQCEALHRCAKFFDARVEEGKKYGVDRGLSRRACPSRKD